MVSDTKSARKNHRFCTSKIAQFQNLFPTLTHHVRSSEDSNAIPVPLCRVALCIESSDGGKVMLCFIHPIQLLKMNAAE